MESFTVAEFGRSTSRVAFAAEREPVEITRREKRVAVVVSPANWLFAETAMAWYTELRDGCADWDAKHPPEESSGSPEPRTAYTGPACGGCRGSGTRGDEECPDCAGTGEEARNA